MRRGAEARLALAALLLGCPALAGEAVPDGAFLEFLGWMVEQDGEYLDPLDLAEVALADVAAEGAAPAGGTEDDDARDN